MEKIEWTRYDGLGYLTIKLSGGGACVELTDGMRSDVAICQLRRLARLLEKGVEDRRDNRK